MKTIIVRPRARLLFSSLAALFCATSSSAQASEYFGELGQIVIGGGSSVDASWAHQYEHDGAAAKSSSALSLTPSVGVFLLKNTLLAVDVGLGGAFDKDFDGPVSLSAGPKVGYNINLGRGVSLLPAATAHYRYDFRSTSLDKRGQQVKVGIEVPFYFQLVKHGALNFGPAVSHILTQGGTTRVGLVGGVTLWI